MMSAIKLPEVWLRGPLPRIPGLLQPVAHALLQAREEVIEIMSAFPEPHLWKKPAGLASVGFHLQHLSGVLDRLFTYARGEMLNAQQLKNLNEEGKNSGENPLNVISLVAKFEKQVDHSIMELTNTNEIALSEIRYVGKSQIPSTLLGLLVHAAEHTQRHVGQLLVTVSVLKAGLK